jgi:hypothetical protein
MKRLTVGFSCALVSVALLIYTIWLSQGGAFDAAMASLLIALVLFLVAALMLRRGGSRL